MACSQIQTPRNTSASTGFQTKGGRHHGVMARIVLSDGPTTQTVFKPQILDYKNALQELTARRTSGPLDAGAEYKRQLQDKWTGYCKKFIDIVRPDLVNEALPGLFAKKDCANVEANQANECCKTVCSSDARGPAICSKNAQSQFSLPTYSCD